MNIQTINNDTSYPWSGNADSSFVSLSVGNRHQYPVYLMLLIMFQC